MHLSMMNEVVETMLSDRRREAARQRRIAAARRAGRSQHDVAAWRIRVGSLLIAAGSVVGGATARHASVRGAGGPFVAVTHGRGRPTGTRG
jgi:hypothetical protein